MLTSLWLNNNTALRWGYENTLLWYSVALLLCCVSGSRSSCNSSSNWKNSGRLRKVPQSVLREISRIGDREIVFVNPPAISTHLKAKEWTLGHLQKWADNSISCWIFRCRTHRCQGASERVSLTSRPTSDPFCVNLLLLPFSSVPTSPLNSFQYAYPLIFAQRRELIHSVL